MKVKVLLLAMVAAGFSVGAMAQTCDAPLPIASNSTATGDLCTASNTLPGYGGIGSPQAEIIYAFEAQGADAVISLAETGAPFGATMVLMPTPCHSSTDVIAIGDFANPMVIGGLTDGAMYYVIVTGDPGGPADACGGFSATVDGTLPVNLQNVTVD